jgi:hypothetical protein
VFEQRVILMKRTDKVLETLVYSPFMHPTLLLARFIEFSRRESFTPKVLLKN